MIFSFARLILPPLRRELERMACKWTAIPYVQNSIFRIPPRHRNGLGDAKIAQVNNSEDRIEDMSCRHESLPHYKLSSHYL